VTGIAARLGTRLGDFTLDVAIEGPGTGIIGLFGASGSGKTTILRCIAGLHRAESAEVHLNGNVWQDEAKRVFVPTHRRGIGYVSQDADLFPHLSVQDNLRYAQRRVPLGAETTSWTDVMEWLAVEPLLQRTVPNLSGGERQRVALARALLASPKLLLMDEPLSALDEPARHEVVRYLERALEHLAVPVVYVSHSLTEVARLAHRLVWLADGRVVDSGSVSQILSRLDFARWRGEEPAVVLEGTVKAHDEEFHLTGIDTPLGSLTIHRRPEQPGTHIRVQINARDVSLGLTPQEASSILNELPLTVLETSPLSASSCLVRLGPQTGEGPVLLARITHKSRRELSLDPGRRVFARIKSVAVLD
jgi:molybdate transport system ATP-binding protein